MEKEGVNSKVKNIIRNTTTTTTITTTTKQCIFNQRSLLAGTLQS